MALSSTSSSQMTCALMGLQPVILESQNPMNAVDGATIERRIRNNRPDDENGRKPYDLFHGQLRGQCQIADGGSEKARRLAASHHSVVEREA
jgi:hypothetical protein